MGDFADDDWFFADKEQLEREQTAKKDELYEKYESKSKNERRKSKASWSREEFARYNSIVSLKTSEVKGSQR